MAASDKEFEDFKKQFEGRSHMLVQLHRFARIVIHIRMCLNETFCMYMCCCSSPQTIVAISDCLCHQPQLMRQPCSIICVVSQGVNTA